MNKKTIIKSSIVAVMAILTSVLTGCKSVPTVETMYTTSLAVGFTTGMVVNQTKIDDESRNVIVDIINIVDDCVPATNETFEAAWTPIAEAHTKKLVEDGKIDVKQAEIILCAFKTVTKGIDYLFDVRFPKARQYQDLTTAAVHGFSSGFLTTFKPANTFCSAPIDFDKKAYDYLNSAK